MKDYNHILLRANSIEGVNISEFCDYPDAEIIRTDDFIDSLATAGTEDIFTLILPAGTDGIFEIIDNEYGIR